MALKQNEQRQLKADVMEQVQAILKEKGFEICEQVEKGIAIGVLKDGNPAPADFSQETYFFVVNVVFKKDFDLDEEVEEYQKKLEKQRQKENGEKPKVSVRDLKTDELSEEDLKILQEKLAKAKATKEKQGIQLKKTDETNKKVDETKKQTKKSDKK